MLDAAAAKTGDTEVSQWSRQQLAFAERHTAKLQLWYIPRRKVIRRQTPLRLYDKQCILTRLRRYPTEGLHITDIVKEYADAYKDVYALMQNKLINVHNNTIWINQASSKLGNSTR